MSYVDLFNSVNPSNSFSWSGSYLAGQKTLSRFFFFSNFDEDQQANIYRHCHKEHLKIMKLTKFKGETSKVSEYVT